MNTRAPFRYAVLIAAYNEADRIQSTVAAAALVPGVVGVIVVDDGSKDDTAGEASRAGAMVVSNKSNRGKGTAMELAAFTLLSEQPFGNLDGVILLDGDLEESASAAGELLKPLEAGMADLAIGIMPRPSGKAGFGWVQTLARDGIAKHGGGFEAKAPLCGQRALTLNCLDCVRPFAHGYAMEVDMTIKALRQHLRVDELPVEMRHRATGRDLKGFLHRGKQYFEIRKLLNSIKA